MPYGTGPLLGSALAGARPWQRCVICFAMIAGGVLLVVVGHVGGALLSAAGIFLLWRMVRHRPGRPRGRSSPVAGFSRDRRG